MKKNDVINLKINDVRIEGVGIGRHENMVVFVPSAAIGDNLRVKIIKLSKNYVVGKIEEILSFSPDRIPPDCAYYPKCGGCSFRHISYEAELRIKSKHVFGCLERIGGFKEIKLEPIISSEKINFYRNKSQIPLGKNSEGKVIGGFFGSRSHRIVDCSNCLLHPKEFNKIVDAIKWWIKELNISIYDEQSHSGLLRHIYLRYAESTGEIMVCLVINGYLIPFEEELVNCLRSLSLNIVSIYLNVNTKKSNVILGKECKLIWGKEKITDFLCGLKFEISPLSFYQVNRSQAEKLYITIKENIVSLENPEILDLYCGIGTIGLSLSRNARKVLGVEIVKEAVKDAKKNAFSNEIVNSEFVCCDASELEDKMIINDVDNRIVVIDPPRKGCTLTLIESIIKIRPNILVYVSCNPATLARDLKFFCRQGFEIQKVIPIDMFPRTCHVETIVLLAWKS